MVGDFFKDIAEGYNNVLKNALELQVNEKAQIISDSHNNIHKFSSKIADALALENTKQSDKKTVTTNNFYLSV